MIAEAVFLVWVCTLPPQSDVPVKPTCRPEALTATVDNPQQGPLACQKLAEAAQARWGENETEAAQPLGCITTVYQGILVGDPEAE